MSSPKPSGPGAAGEIFHLAWHTKHIPAQAGYSLPAILPTREKPPWSRATLSRMARLVLVRSAGVAPATPHIALTLSGTLPGIISFLDDPGHSWVTVF